MTISGLLHFTMVKCTSRRPDASKMNKKRILGRCCEKHSSDIHSCDPGPHNRRSFSPCQEICCVWGAWIEEMGSSKPPPKPPPQKTQNRLRSSKIMILAETSLKKCLGKITQNYYFWTGVFFKIVILAETSFKNRHLAYAATFFLFIEKIIKIELSPTREARNGIFGFCKKCHLLHRENVQIELSPTRELDFDHVQSLQKFLKKNCPFLEFCILRW